MSAAPSLRSRQLGAVHALKKKLGLDDDAYRLMLFEIAGVRSAADLDAAGMNRVLDHMQKLAKSVNRPDPTKGKPNNLKERPLLTKIGAMLADKGRPWSYGDGIAKRMFKVERLQFCTEKQLSAVVAALHRDAERHDGSTP